jgi:hypothetical protein
MFIKKFAAVIFSLLLIGVCSVNGKEKDSNPMPKGAKVFIVPMENGFHEFLKEAIGKKEVPLVVVDDKAQADYEISGHSETQKAGKAKKIIFLDWRSNEQASIQIVNLKTGTVIFAYSVNKINSWHGKKSSAEACAKHIKEKIEKGN